MLGEESTYGTAVVPTAGLLHNTESLTVTEEMTQANSLNRRGVHSGMRAQGKITVGGSFAFDVRFNWRAFSMLLKHAIGSVATSRPDITSNPLVYNHTFTPATALPTGLTVEVAKDLHAHRFSGCKVRSLELAFAAGGQLVCTVDFVGKDQTWVFGPTALALLGGEGQLATATAGALTWGGATQGKVLAGRFRVDNPLQDTLAIDARTIQEPQRNGFQVFTGDWTFQTEGTDLQSDYRNKTRRELVVTLDGETISSTYKFRVRATMSNAELLETPFQPADNQGILQATVGYQAFVNESVANEVAFLLQNSHPVAA